MLTRVIAALENDGDEEGAREVRALVEERDLAIDRADRLEATYAENRRVLLQHVRVASRQSARQDPDLGESL